VGEELYIADVPFMDSLSFTFLLFASYCMALVFLLPAVPGSNSRRLDLVLDPSIRTGWPSLVLAALFLMFIDVIIDPVALRGDRWFLGRIYGYPDPGVYFGIPLMNFIGWAVVGLISLSLYFLVDRRLPPLPRITSSTRHVLLGCALYYAVLVFNLSVTFWIGEPLLGLVGIMIYVPVTILLALRLLNCLPGPVTSVRASFSQPCASQD
jgi:putative membrane protein